MPNDAAILAALDDGDQIAAKMRSFYLLLLEQSFEDAAALLDVDIAFELDNPAVQKVLEELATMVRSVAETTRNEIRNLVGRQADEGWSNDQLAAEIRSLKGIHSDTRAQVIARSEEARASSKGSILAWQESGVVTKQEWLTSEEACPICTPLSGKVVALGEEFAPGIAVPGDTHPNCTCAIAPVL